MVVAKNRVRRLAVAGGASTFLGGILVDGKPRRVDSQFDEMTDVDVFFQHIMRNLESIAVLAMHGHSVDQPIPIGELRDYVFNHVAVFYTGVMMQIARLSILARTFAALSVPLLAIVAAHATDGDSLELFEKQVRPALVAHCIRCHGEKKQQGGLRLDSRDGWLVGGDSGPAIVPGNPAESLLVSALKYENAELEMPPKGVLPETTIQAIEKWVRLGAVDPRREISSAASPTGSPGAAPSVEEGRSFWSFQPIGRPAVPEVNGDDWSRTDIDRFIIARLQQNGLRPVADADPVTLIRRVHFDLIGLPPTPQQIDQFVNDRSANAYPDLIDRLLDSPQFGERWGRHWLDVVRFAESSGGGRTLLFPDAWRYRDYVIDCFNNDVPYDQFLREQIAGDLLESTDWRDKQRKLIATAFLLIGPTNYEMQDKDILEMDVVDEQLDTIGKSMLGMTIGCARCHDHKFDPIPTSDYYAMAGILKSTKAMIHSNVSQWNTVGLPLSDEQESEIAAHAQRLASVKSELKKATARWVAAGGKPDNKKTAKRKSIDAKSLHGIVVDDTQAQRIGDWTESTSIAGFVGKRYIHDGAADKGKKSVIYRPSLPTSGRYEVRISYTIGANRSTHTPVHVHHSGGETVVLVNQRTVPPIDDTLTSLGQFEFDPADDPRVVISNEGTAGGVVIADAVVLLSAADQSLSRTDDKETDKNRTELKSEAEVAADVGGDDDPSDPQVLERFKLEVDSLAKKVKSMEKSGPRRPVAMATADDDDAGDIHVAIGGVVHHPGSIAPRGVMRVAQTEPFPPIPTGQSGRKEFADWISSGKNPLTARVMANRVWHWLIGRGIVATVDNFGSTGQGASNAMLLDHLASSLIDSGWSTKRLISEIMLSRVYRLSSDPNGDPNGDARQVDPENRLLWRMNRKRLNAEDVRDAFLLVSGELDKKRGGSGIKKGTSSEYGYKFDGKRRSVYVPVFRNRLPELFEVFDFADPNIQRGQRTVSTVASQALFLMNHPFVLQRSQLAAEKLLRGDLTATADRVQYAYRQVLGRVPRDEELSVAVGFIESGGHNEHDPANWTMLYQTLFQCVDFRYLN